MKAQVHYASINRVSTCEASMCSVLDVSIENRIPHLHECGWHGKCTTCRIRVLEGEHNLSAKTQIEKDLTQARKWDPSIRLACQCYVKGEVKVQRLIWSSAEVNKLQMELAPEDKAEERPIAILFCDLRNFTRLSTNHAAFDMAYFLNRFYTTLGDPILMNNGIIYQYVGDEIVGVFGTAGGTQQKNCMDAIRAAKGMQYALERLNKLELENFNVELKMGIGINFGLSYVGYLGHPNNRQFSVIGDPVNIASRIQGQTKETSTEILISEAVYRNTETDVLEIGAQYTCLLAGKENRVDLYEVIGFKELDLPLKLQHSLHLLLKNEEKFAAVFYEKLFTVAPFVKHLFQNDMQTQGRLLIHMLAGIVYSLARPEHLILGLKKLGQNHQRYGVKEAYYPIVKNVFLDTIPDVLGDLYKPRISEVWPQALDFVLDTMKEGASQPSLDKD